MQECMETLLNHFFPMTTCIMLQDLKKINSNASNLRVYFQMC